MSTPVLATKLYIPPPRHNAISRPHLLARLNAGLQCKLTLISAPAGFGKTALLSAWISELKTTNSALQEKRSRQPGVIRNAESTNPQVAWLSLDEGDNDPARFLTYFVAALQTLAPQIGSGVVATLQSPQPPPGEVLLTLLLNDLATLNEPFVLILDDYHVIESKAVDQALTFLLEHLPPQMRLIIATREDPSLPLARLRARNHLSELRISDLRFTLREAADFLSQVMALKLSPEEIAALESRTEGWVAGLQLAALALQGAHTAQGQHDTASFIKSFTGSHRFVMDYLVEEVLQQQSPAIQRFLLRTSILNRLCASLCEALLDEPAGQATLQALEQANLFIIPLDNQRRWYRYHHLFAELLRQRLHQQNESSLASGQSDIDKLHIRASQWFEANGLEFEAFQHAAAAHDVERAERLSSGDGILLHSSGMVKAILDWLGSLPVSVLNERPALWWKYASLLLVNGQTTGVEEKLQAIEAALGNAKGGSAQALDEKSRTLIGKIATARATLALTRYQPETILVQSRIALEYLPLDNYSLRSNVNWTLGYAHFLQGNRVAAGRAYSEAIALSQAAGDIFSTILATTGLGNIQEMDNQLQLAAQTFQHILHLAGDQPQQIIYDARLGLARIHYEWNELEIAEQHGQQSLQLARQYDKVIDRFIVCELFLARLKLAQGDVEAAAAIVAQAAQAARQQNFVHRIAEVAAAEVIVLLRQGKLAAAAQLAQMHPLPISQVRVQLASGESEAALALLTPIRQEMEAKQWADERLKVMVLQVIALHLHGETASALQLLETALALAEPAGMIRLFVDEGAVMAQLLAQLLAQSAASGTMQGFASKVLAACNAEQATGSSAPQPPNTATPQPLIEPLSQRELEVLRLIAQGFSNQEIATELFLALDTVKGHNRRIFDKLQVQRRTEAIARARALGLFQD